jgi:hypothetical protein
MNKKQEKLLREFIKLLINERLEFINTISTSHKAGGFSEKKESNPDKKYLAKNITESHDGLYPTAYDIAMGQYKNDARTKGVFGNTSPPPEKVKTIKLPDAVKKDISDFNKVLNEWAEEKLDSLYNENSENQNSFEDAISDAASLFVDMGGSDDFEIKSSDFLSLFLEKIKEAFKLELNVYNYRSNVPQFEFELSIPVLGGEGFEGEIYRDTFGRIIERKGSLDAAFERSLESMEEKIKTIFDNNVNTIIQAWDNDKVFEYVKDELKNNSEGTKNIDITALSNLLTGGAIHVSGITSELQSIGIPEDFAKSMRNIGILEAVEFWITVGGIAGGVDAIKTFREISNASRSGDLRLLRALGQTVVSLGRLFLKGVIRYICYVCIPALIFSAVSNGINIVRKPLYAKRLIETYKSSVLKMMKIYFDDLKKIKGEIIEEILNYSTDYEAIYGMIKKQSKISYSKIQQEIKKSLEYSGSVRDIVDTEAMTFEQFFFSGAYIPGAIFKYLFMGKPTLHISYDEHIENMGGREMLIGKYQNYYKDIDFASMGNKDLYRFIETHEAMRAMDYFEWYGKTNEAKKGNIFSPREGQFLNDIFKMSNNKIADKNTDESDSEEYDNYKIDVAQEEEGEATFFSNFVESSPTAIINSINAALFSIIISIDSESNIIPDVLEQMDGVFDLIIEAVEENDESIWKAFPLQKIENVFSKIEMSNDKIFVTTKNKTFSSQKFPLKIFKKRL